MYELKKKPEDFCVEEIPDRKFREKGKYTILTLKKKNYTTEDAITKLCKIYNTQRKQIGYAGIKDRNAITKQHISILKQVSPHTEKDLKTEIIGYAEDPITLGDLKGNKFTIVARNLEKETHAKTIDKFPNYFDKQRFSGNNKEIGKAIINKEWKNACDMIIEHEGSYREEIKKSLRKSPKGYINALKSMPRKILMLYVHAYQSWIWNQTLREYLNHQKKQEIQTQKNTEKENATIPIIGFATEIKEGIIQDIIYNIMEKENITFRDFIIREMPEISFEGNERNAYTEIKNLEIGNKEEDELNEGKYKMTIKFALDKGAYATMAVKYILSEKK